MNSPHVHTVGDAEFEELMRGPLVRGIELRRAIKNALDAGIAKDEIRRMVSDALSDEAAR